MTVQLKVKPGTNLSAIAKELADNNFAEQRVFAVEGFVDKSLNGGAYFSSGRKKDDQLVIIITDASQDKILEFQYNQFKFRVKDGYTSGQLQKLAVRLINADVTTEQVEYQKWNPLMLKLKVRNTWNIEGQSISLITPEDKPLNIKSKDLPQSLLS